MSYLPLMISSIESRYLFISSVPASLRFSWDLLVAAVLYSGVSQPCKFPKPNVFDAGSQIHLFD